MICQSHSGVSLRGLYLRSTHVGTLLVTEKKDLSLLGVNPNFYTPPKPYMSIGNGFLLQETRSSNQRRWLALLRYHLLLRVKEIAN